MAGRGDALVFIHGFSLDHRMWDDQFEVLAQHYQVIRYDLRGFGQSAPPEGQRYDHADDLKALLDHLGIAQAHLIGLSLGGWVATNFVLAHPEATRSLVLVDSVIEGFTWSPAYLAAVQPIWRRAREAGVAAAKECWLQCPLFEPALQSAAVAPRLKQIINDYSGWHFINDDPRDSVVVTTQQLRRLTAPTLIVVGEHDLPDFHAIAEMLTVIPGARKVILPGSGHMANMEAPQRFNEIILEFLNK
jgi:pimeloyl-ACP methyl ester carboxylesterase